MKKMQMNSSFCVAEVTVVVRKLTSAVEKTLEGLGQR